MKMESVEFYAQLLYQSKLLGGPKEFDKETIEKLYEIRRKMGLPGKHPADLCQNKDGINCHNCGGCMGCSFSGVRSSGSRCRTDRKHHKTGNGTAWNEIILTE